MKTPKVSFFVIGAQKGGTTSLLQYLNQHPKIKMPLDETHYFDKNLSNYDYNFYESKFPYNADKFLIGVKTPSYMYIRNSMDEIYKYNPNAKLIITLRNPIERAFSQWNMYRRLNITKDSFLDSIKNTENTTLEEIKENGPYFLQRGLYYEHISYILTKFPKEQVLILISEKMKENPKLETEKVFNFLNLETPTNINYSFVAHKGLYESRMTEDEIMYLKSFYKEPNTKLFNFLGNVIEEWK